MFQIFLSKVSHDGGKMPYCYFIKSNKISIKLYYVGPKIHRKLGLYLYLYANMLSLLTGLCQLKTKNKNDI